VVIALFLCSKKKKKIRLLSKDRYKRRPQYWHETSLQS
jgi:hypothetical protein